jgi:putative serine protease PepD
MKGKTIIAALGVGAAAFAGVFGALELKDHLATDQATTSIFKTSGDMIHNVADVPVAPAAFDFKGASKKVMPSVVSIDRLQRVDRYFMDNQGEVQETGQGSGVIISKDGYIVTNNHVVEGAQALKVRTPDHKTYDAEVLGRDPRADLAVIKVKANNLTPVEMGDSDQLAVGEWVMAVGNPLGFDNTVSVGVVSSLKRSLPIGQGVLLNAIQTDAAINPGNSGGALTNAQGQLIGINSAIASSTGQSVGIGFAIPVDRVKEVAADIIKYGHARYAGLGISYNPSWGENFLSDPDVRSQLADITGSSEIPQKGILVKSPYRGSPSVDPGGAADKAGIQEFDVILAIDGQPVADAVTLSEVLTPKKPGDTVEIKFWSRGKTKTAKVQLQELRDRI